MNELIAHTFTEHGGLKQWLTITSEDAVKNYRTLFGDHGVKGINNALKLYPTNQFYEIKRYFQFVGVLKYTPLPTPLISMSLFECENMDTYLDSFFILQGSNWKQKDLDQIGNILQEILNDKNKVLATIQFNKLL